MLEDVSENKKENAEKAKEKKCIENLRRFAGTVLSDLPVCPVSVIERQERLYYSRNPEEAYQSGYEEEHFPCTYFSPGQVALGKDYTDYQEYNETHQLK